MHLQRFFFATAAVVMPLVCAAKSIEPPAVPSNLSVPAGSKAFLLGHAVGTQNYVCLPSDGGAKWVLFGPQATLLDDQHQQLMTHFLSPNPAENGTPRPAWQDSKTTDSVWAVKDQESDDPKFVAPGAIKWFLLRVAGAKASKPAGDRLAGTKFIQRVNTTGGVAPAAECATAGDVGKTKHVPYTADYVFYK